MNIVLDSGGLTLTLFFALVFLAKSHSLGDSLFFSLCCLQGALIFLKEILLRTGYLGHFPYFLIYANFLYGLPSIYLFATRDSSRRGVRSLRQYLPTLLNLPLSFLASAFTQDVSSIDGAIRLSAGLIVNLPVFYVNALALGETAQVAIYGALGFRFFFAKRATEADGKIVTKGTTSRVKPIMFFAVVGCYVFYYAARWAGYLFRFLAYDDRVLPPFPAWVGQVMVGLVAVFCLGIAFYIALAAQNALRPDSGEVEKSPRAKYGGKVLSADESSRIVRRAREYLARQKDLSDEAISTHRLALAVGVPYYVLSMAVNQSVRKTVGDVIREERLARAKALLDANPDSLVIDVAYDSGFGSKSAFNAAFKQRYGVTPSEYRASPLKELP